MLVRAGEGKVKRKESNSASGRREYKWSISESAMFFSRGVSDKQQGMNNMDMTVGDVEPSRPRMLRKRFKQRFFEYSTEGRLEHGTNLLFVASRPLAISTPDHV